MRLIQRAFVLILCALNIQNGQKCRLNTRIHFEEPLPVILRNGRLLEPTDKYGDIELNYGDTITLSCEGTGESIQHPNAQSGQAVATISCEGGEMFKNEEWLNEPARFSLFKCSTPPQHRSKRTQRTCYDKNPIFEVGYTVSYEFYPVYETCFNEAAKTPFYSKYTQKPYNSFFQQRVKWPYFTADENFAVYQANYLFSPEGLKAAVAARVGAVVKEYFTKTQSLSRGHLAAKTDFPLAFGERATFHYANIAPQWTGFNGGNWNTLEVDLRNHIHNANYDTIIYTGAFGISQLMSDSGRTVDIHLHHDENNNPVIPVPLFFYKVVYETESKNGVVFVGINNPYITEEEASHMEFCENVCKQKSHFPWLTWHPRNISEGYMFCCTVQDFRLTVPHLPYFQVQGLLR